MKEHTKALAVVKRLPAIIRREIDSTPLPFNFKAAELAVRQCARVDEAKDIANKAEAIATYAREIRDMTMHDEAKRIVLRAMRRMGELLEEYEKEHGLDAKRKLGRQLGSAAKRCKAEALARLPEAAWEKHLAKSPVPTPTMIMRAEGCMGSGAPAPRMPIHKVMSALVTIDSERHLLSAERLGKHFRSQMYLSMLPMLRKVIDYLDRAEQVATPTKRTGT